MTDVNPPTQSEGIVSAGAAVKAVGGREGPAIKKPLL
jgi:hypothetical protein